MATGKRTKAPGRRTSGRSTNAALRRSTSRRKAASASPHRDRPATKPAATIRPPVPQDYPKVRTSKETLTRRRARTAQILRRLHAAYPESRISLRYGNDFQLLVAVILSAQCTDARVNMVTPRLFAELADPTAFAAADRGRIEELIRSTGFFRSKAKNLQEMAKRLLDEHGGRVPATMEELVALPGVARKTANVVLHHAHGKREGIAVDTHVSRIAPRLGLTRTTDPKKVEQDLLKLVPEEERGILTHLFIDHGRAVCRGQGRPLCERCVVADLCASAFVVWKRDPGAKAVKGATKRA